ncbi:hypothetical protein Q3O97_05570 [Ralstonia pseudosolanacearum]|uniref:hypothetical protein n=1 Tax=Ralstonia pseudosolanacearum TaxID=1310165 RepID=UPI0026FCC2FD|nr:hypothetical protein [Ralstonia pseudosolanacearum]MDO3615306.1 hypothetical protein [Ralstonia pseudosolanacearum]
MKTSTLDRAPTRAGYAALRAWLQGVRPMAVASRWLSSDPDTEWSEADALRALKALRTTLAQLALRHHREPLANCLPPAHAGRWPSTACSWACVNWSGSARRRRRSNTMYGCGSRHRSQSG